MNQHNIKHPIKAIIGLGNPGPQYYHTRHSIGFRVMDALADRYFGQWQAKEHMELATIQVQSQKIFLIKPQTFMNTSGKVVPFLLKQGIKPENMLVVHDELEKPFGKLAFKVGGSHRGHNGLRSIIGVCGPEFARLRFGIGRPERKEDVSNYVLQKFKPDEDVRKPIEDAVEMIEKILVLED